MKQDTTQDFPFLSQVLISSNSEGSAARFPRHLVDLWKYHDLPVMKDLAGFFIFCSNECLSQPIDCCGRIFPSQQDHRDLLIFSQLHGFCHSFPFFQAVHFEV